VEARIEAGFRHRFAAALAQLPGEERASAEERAAEVERLVAQARQRASRGDTDLLHALLDVDARLTARRAVERTEGAAAVPQFLCDASLGGLARWLRAAGYEAWLTPTVRPERLPDEALAHGAVLLTTDAEVLERRIVANGSLRVSWLPTPLLVGEKLALVFRDFGLGLREPRCMACGGSLAARSKDSVSPRIPPRTARWKDEYFVCSACDRLFWQGTHWERIASVLRSLSVAA
jgi:uncharacterized protein with PIN domain